MTGKLSSFRFLETTMIDDAGHTIFRCLKGAEPSSDYLFGIKDLRRMMPYSERDPL